jgi:hypothetical protein
LFAAIRASSRGCAWLPSGAAVHRQIGVAEQLARWFISL